MLPRFSRGVTTVLGRWRVSSNQYNQSRDDDGCSGCFDWGAEKWWSSFDTIAASLPQDFRIPHHRSGATCPIDHVHHGDRSRRHTDVKLTVPKNQHDPLPTPPLACALFDPAATLRRIEAATPFRRHRTSVVLYCALYTHIMHIIIMLQYTSCYMIRVVLIRNLTFATWLEYRRLRR